MYIVTEYPLAVFFCFITMLAWGSWANTYKLVDKNWRFELFYWDFALGILLFALAFGLTLGSNGMEGRSFISDMAQADSKNLFSAVFGGFIWNLANLLLVAAMALAGLAVAFSVGTGIGWMMGILINYISAPVGNGWMILLGSLCILTAILITMQAYRNRSSDTKPSPKGIVLAALGGIIIAWYYSFVASSIVTDFASPEAGKITPYTAVFFFAVGVFMSSFIYNTFLMRNPVEGNPVSFADYFKADFKTHFVGVLGGCVWCLALSLSFLSAGTAGYAISYGLGNGGTVVAIAWGVFVWQEFRNSSMQTNALLTLMFTFYILGLTLLVFARYF